jgi:Domain of unknown function (DUF5655)/Domain of unknown function (DUF4287)
MADLQAATLPQLRNIQARTGKPIAELHAVLAASGLAKAGERRSLLMEQFTLGYGDAKTVALFYDKPLPPLAAAAAAAGPEIANAAGDPLDAVYTGAKAPLRALHAALLQQVICFGDLEQAPKKAYVSLRRKKQFDMMGPATRDVIEIGLNARNLASGPRLKTMPAGGMWPYTLRITDPADINAELVTWLRAANNAAA